MGVSSVTVAYLIHYDSLLQNVKDIITKCDKSLLQNASGFFISKCDSFITECGSYCNLRRFYYKMRQFLQNAAVERLYWKLSYKMLAIAFQVIYVT